MTVVGLTNAPVDDVSNVSAKTSATNSFIRFHSNFSNSVIRRETGPFSIASSEYSRKVNCARRHPPFQVAGDRKTVAASFLATHAARPTPSGIAWVGSAFQLPSRRYCEDRQDHAEAAITRNVALPPARLNENPIHSAASTPAPLSSRAEALTTRAIRRSGVCEALAER